MANTNILEITVTKMTTTTNRTISRMDLNGLPFCFVLEDGIKNIKVAGQTCISDGRYQVIKRFYGKFFESYKKRFGHKYALEIKDVPEFKDILIHIGNYISDTRGCLLVGQDVTFNELPNGIMFIARSTNAYKALYDIVSVWLDANKEVWITITR